MIELPNDGYKLARWNINPTGSTTVQFEQDGTWHAMNVVGSVASVGIKGPTYVGSDHPEAVTITATCLPRLKDANGEIAWDELIYLWDPEDNH